MRRRLSVQTEIVQSLRVDRVSRDEGHVLHVESRRVGDRWCVTLRPFGSHAPGAAGEHRYLVGAFAEARASYDAAVHAGRALFAPLTLSEFFAVEIALWRAGAFSEDRD